MHCFAVVFREFADDLLLDLIVKRIGGLWAVLRRLKDAEAKARRITGSRWNQALLKQQGVARMEVVGQEFDPNLHEAVLREESNEFAEDVVCEELQRGYHRDGRVLRHAMVKVSMGPGPSDAAPAEATPNQTEEEA